MVKHCLFAEGLVVGPGGEQGVFAAVDPQEGKQIAQKKQHFVKGNQLQRQAAAGQHDAGGQPRPKSDAVGHLEGLDIGQ